MLGPKFWQIYRKEGVMRAVQRGRPHKLNHEKGGYGEELVKCVGTDEYGNRYYEDFNHLNFNTRRWVEYADHGKTIPLPKKIAPAWHGWMHYQYDDPPKKDNFVEPFFRSHKTIVYKTDHPNAYKNPGHLMAPDRKLYEEIAKARKYTSWEPPVGGERTVGKKILVANKGPKIEENVELD